MARPEDRFSNTVEDAGRYEMWRSQDDYDPYRYVGDDPSGKEDDGPAYPTGDCKCGKNRFVDDRYGRWECEECKTGPAIETFHRTLVRTARKDHPGTDIKAGDRYQESVYGGYYRGGSRWLKSSKHKLLAPLIQGFRLTTQEG